MLSIAFLVAAAVTPAAGQRLAIEPGAAQVKRFEKIEFSLSGNPVFANPYDPEQVDLGLEIVAPSGKRIVLPAFYYQPFESKPIEQERRPDARDRKAIPAEWYYPVGKAVWKARFAPAEVGRYTCTAQRKDRAGTVRSRPVTFESLPSDGKGFVRVSKKAPSYLEFDNGSPLYVIGQNAAFVKNLYETLDIFHRMAAEGANYARVWACCEDWGMAIEGQKNGWTRTWARDRITGVQPGRDGRTTEACVRIEGDAGRSLSFNPNHRVALRPGVQYRMTFAVKSDDPNGAALEISGAGENLKVNATRDWTPHEQVFTNPPNRLWLQAVSFRLGSKGAVWLRDLSLREAGGGPELFWESNVNRPPRGDYNQVDSFILDNVIEAAEREGLYIQLVILPRDRYMRYLNKEGAPEYQAATADAAKLLRYAVARWGYSTHIAAWEYFNEMDPGKPTDRFYGDLADYLDQADPYRHLRATSGWSPSLKDWKHPQLDTADMHYYLRPAEGERFKDDALTYANRIRFLKDRAPSKPAIFSEFGMTADNFQRTELIDQDREFVHIHNGLWIALHSGLAGALPWFWDEIAKKDMYHHYRPIANYVAGFPFTTADLAPATPTLSDDSFRALCVRGRSSALLWLFNPQATWHRIGVEKTTPSALTGKTVTIENLAPGAYNVEWWDPWKGAVIAREKKQTEGSKLLLPVPPFSRDIACKVFFSQS